MNAGPGPMLAALWMGALLQAAACDRADDGSPREAVTTGSVIAARVDTVRGRLTSDSHARLSQGAIQGGASVLLVLRPSDVRTCEDLGRQARELRRWATARGATLVVWAANDSADAVTAFLDRERLRASVLVRVPFLPRLRDPAELATPAALLVDADGSVRGTAHPDRVPNVRTTSFADELEALLVAAPAERPTASE